MMLRQRRSRKLMMPRRGVGHPRHRRIIGQCAHREAKRAYYEQKSHPNPHTSTLKENAMHINGRPEWLGLGWLLALIGLLIVIVFWASGHALSKDQMLGLFALAFLSRLIP